MTWKTLESAIALASNIARDYLKYKTSDTNEKKALENDIESNPQNYTDTVFTEEVTDNNKEFNNNAFTDLENEIKSNPQDFVNHESPAISEEASHLLDNDKRNDEVSEDMFDQIRKENEDWKNKLIEKYNSQNQYEMPEDLFSDLEEEDLDYAIQMIDDLVFGKEAGKTENLDDWIEQAQADDAYAMGTEELNYLPPEQFKQVGAFLGGNPAEIKDDITDVEYNIRDAEPVEEVIPESNAEEVNTEEEVVEETEESKKSKRRNNFLDKLKRSISINPANGSFKAEETDTVESKNGGAVGKGIGSNITGQGGGVGVNANLGGSPEKEQELEEYKEQRNIDSELHYDDVPVENISSVNNPGANNGNIEDEDKHNINVPKANSNFTVKNTKLDGKTGHKYGKNNIELDEVETNNADELEEVLKSLDDYSAFQPLVIENVDNEILIDGSPLKMVGDETLKFIEEKLKEIK